MTVEQLIDYLNQFSNNTRVYLIASEAKKYEEQDADGYIILEPLNFSRKA